MASAVARGGFSLEEYGFRVSRYPAFSPSFWSKAFNAGGTFFSALALVAKLINNYY
jgi:hypothetical protein